MPVRPPTFCEFFAGGGLVRAGLGPGWSCLLANDIDARKAASYRRNWGGEALFEGDVRAAGPHLPALAPDLVWASFPCQDLSLAGSGAGLEGARSGAFWPFWGHMHTLAQSGRAPGLIVLENVAGLLSSRQGRDFAAIAQAFAGLGYRLGGLVIDAACFLPQSRPRLFLLGVRAEMELPAGLVCGAGQSEWTPPALQRAAAGSAGWVWWRVPPPPRRNTTLADVLEESPPDAQWRTGAETQRLLALMAPSHRARLEEARAAGVRMVGALYRRTRPAGDGGRVQRAEVRFDGLAGCLRTPGGGSSRQTILLIEGGEVRARLLSPRETARLMGLPEEYILPAAATDAYHLTGDGVAVPVVKHLSEHLFLPLLRGQGARRAA